MTANPGPHAPAPSASPCPGPRSAKPAWIAWIRRLSTLVVETDAECGGGSPPASRPGGTGAAQGVGGGEGRGVGGTVGGGAVEGGDQRAGGGAGFGKVEAERQAVVVVAQIHGAPSRLAVDVDADAHRDAVGVAVERVVAARNG